MTSLLIVLVSALAIALAALGWQYYQLRIKLESYRQIQDAEAYQAECERNAQEALKQRDTLATQANALTEQIAAQKAKTVQYQQLIGKLNSAAELHQRIKRDKTRVQQLTSVIGQLEHAVKLSDYIRGQESTIADKKSEIESLSSTIGSARTATEIAAKVQYFENYLAQLKSDVELIEEAKSLQEFGFYRQRYDFESAVAFENRIDRIRAQQKAMLSEKLACICNTEWTVDGSQSEGKKMVNQQIKLMLRAFNGECDAAVAKVRYNNVVSLENRIRRSFEQISKLGETKRIYLSPEFCNLKFEELHLSHEYQQKKQEERELQREIRDRMREEQKVAKEIEKACESADREQELKSRALEEARAELAQQEGRQTARLELLVSKLENELSEAIDRKAKAIARAQLTKSGHVYILSNIGTFGEGVYKIGMSRRLEPLERVDELGGASVPFPFDVHAMIYSENAPELENALHRHFSARRVNLVNLRREFFRVSLDEIRAAVAEYFGHVSFVLVPEAAQYRQTVVMLNDVESDQSRLQIA